MVVNMDKMSPWIGLNSNQFPPIEHAIERRKSKAMTINHIDPQGDFDVTTVNEKERECCISAGYGVTVARSLGIMALSIKQKLGPYSQQ